MMLSIIDCVKPSSSAESAGPIRTITFVLSRAAGKGSVCSVEEYREDQSTRGIGASDGHFVIGQGVLAVMILQS